VKRSRWFLISFPISCQKHRPSAKDLLWLSSGQKNPLSDPTYVNSLIAGAGLSGNAKTGAVTLKVKNLGITTAMLADTSVATAKIAKGAVTVRVSHRGASCLYLLRNQYTNLPDRIDDTCYRKSLKKRFLISSPRRAK